MPRRLSIGGRFFGGIFARSRCTLSHSLRSDATSSGGALMVDAIRLAEPSSPSSIWLTVLNSVALSSRPCSLSDVEISRIKYFPAPDASARAASTQTGEARKARMPMSSMPLPAVRRTRKSSASFSPLG
jgi:hypothetical protein